MRKFIVSGQYKKLLSCYGINVDMALHMAGKNYDGSSHGQFALEAGRYFQFLDAISEQITDPSIPVRLCSTAGIEMFSPPIFAAYCSRDGASFLDRFATYKRLICPLRFVTMRNKEAFTVSMSADVPGIELSRFVVEIEFVFILHLLRNATRKRITPCVIHMKDPCFDAPFLSFVGCEVERSEENSLTFHPAEMNIPFTSRNDSMWNYLAPELRRRLSRLTAETSFQSRLTSVLAELLPGGNCSIDAMAAKFDMSRRTLQRKLMSEGTTYQKELARTRECLARYYLRQKGLTICDIAYLLGCQELNSFLRAFQSWTGMNLSAYKHRN